MTIIQCEEIMCGHCVSRIKQGLSSAGIDHQVSLETKTVMVEGNQEQVEKSIELLEDMGFTPVKLS